MAGYETLRRRDWNGNVPYRYDAPIASNSTKGWLMPLPTGSHTITSAQVSAPEQVTTSWRTAKRGTERDIFESLPRTSGEVMKMARTQYAHRSTQYDNGHDFETSKQDFWCGFPAMRVVSTTGQGVYTGPVLPHPGDHNVSNQRYPLIPAMDLTWYGTNSINETIPTHPIADLVNMLAELYREGLPKLYGLATATGAKGPRSLASNAGGEYLNHQFGVKPLANDLASVLLGISESEKRIQQLLRDSGKNVRRERTYAPTTETIIYPKKLGRIAHCLVAASSVRDSMFGTAAARGQLQEIVTTERQIRFSGAYTYYLPPELKRPVNELRRLKVMGDHILRTSVNLDTLWELAPWSWLVDWKFNVGDLLSNAVRIQEDGLVIRYAYIMGTTKVRRDVTLTDHPKPGGGVFPPIQASYEVIHKKRVRASPTGFAPKPGPITDRQWNILAALGMTKGSSRQLRLGD